MPATSVRQADLFVQPRGCSTRPDAHTSRGKAATSSLVTRACTAGAGGSGGGLFEAGPGEGGRQVTSVWRPGFA
jgi:hypothetical protein